MGKKKQQIINKRFGIRYNVSDDAFSHLTHCKVKCKKCNHTMLIGNYEKRICRVCGYYVYKNSKLEFKDKLKRELLKH